MAMIERPTVRRVKIELTDREFAHLLQTARAEDIHHHGVYDLRGAVVTVWERTWADTDAWKYLGKVGEIHYQHPASNVPPTVRRLVLYGSHTNDELIGHLAHLIGRERKSMDGILTA
jgi:hypothetical protein